MFPSLLRSVALLAAAVGVALVIAASPATPSAQAAARCHHVITDKYRFSRIRAYNGLSCHRARHKLHRWARRGLPHSMTGWYCQTRRSHAGKRVRLGLCSLGNGNAPYFRFRRTRRHH